uniref:Acyl-CoA thioesterase 19 n=1 Tax=Cynoglossus semilaevis TaxID=244447 RepID=A0A3P8UXN6_CYNSE
PPPPARTRSTDVGSLLKLSVQPSRGLVDEKWKIVLQNATPSCSVTLHAHCTCEDGHNWEAFGHYTSDATGTVDGFLRPVPGSKPGLRMRKTNIQVPTVVTISVYQGHHNMGFTDRVLLASVVVERWYMAPGVRRIPITEGGLTATLFLPPGSGQFPGILDLWGGGGKLVEYRAALFASHGFASLALDYLTCKVTTDTGLVDDEYFETAYRVLQQHPQVMGSRIAMLGLSLGTSITLKMATYSDVIKLRCAVCISGSHVQPVGGSLKDILELFEKNHKKAYVNEEKQVIMRNLLLPIPSEPSLKADVGRLQCSLLLVVGEDDQNWPSYESALDMKEMMEKAGNVHLLTVLSYPNAGHLIEPPYSPHTRYSNFVSVGRREKITVGVLCIWVCLHYSMIHVSSLFFHGHSLHIRCLSN